MNIQLSQPELIKTICNSSENAHLNSATGAAAIITNCKHHAHIECLQKYRTQQATLPEQDYQVQINGLNKGETACPICKCVNNSILPAYSLKQLLESEPELQSVFTKNAVKISNKSIERLTMYADVFD